MAESSQQGNVLPAVFVTLLAAFGITQSLPKPPPPSTPFVNPVTAGREVAASSDDSPHSACEMLSYFLGVADQAKHEGGTLLDCDSVQRGMLSVNDVLRGYHLKSMIATLPEPSSPELRSEFDNDLAAIMSAATDAGYTLDSFYWPWEHTVKNQPQQLEFAPEIDVYGRGARDTSVSQRVFHLQSLKAPERSKEPGLVLFRGIGAQTLDQLRLIFIVGETPTRGIIKEALRDALNQLFRLYTPDNQSQVPLPLKVAGSSWPSSDRRATEETFDIVGPSFSGSVTSLHNELQTWKSEIAQTRPPVHGPLPSLSWASADPPLLNLKFRFLSGSATAVDARNLRLNACPDCVTFRPFAMPDEDRWPLIIRTLQNGVFNVPPSPSGSPPDELLSSGTAGQKKDGPAIALLTDDTEYGNPPNYITTLPNSLVIRYPLHISDLRTAFAGAGPAPVALGPNLSAPDVPESNEDDHQSDDVVPPLSGRSPGYAQLELAALLATLAREHFPYVGIVATDVDDLIFLAGMVRQFSPDSLLFTTSSDLLVLRSTANPDTYGMLVFSSYPLFNANEAWTDPHRKHFLREFPNENSEGIYNATLKALDRPDLLLEQVQPFGSRGSNFFWVDHVSDQASPSTSDASRYQILWASVVGHDTIWPLTFQPTSLSSQAQGINQAIQTIPLPFLFVFLLLILLSGLTSIILLLRPLYLEANMGLWGYVTSYTPTWITDLTDTIDTPIFAPLQKTRRIRLLNLSIALLIAVIIGNAYFGLLAIIGWHSPSNSMPTRLGYFVLAILTASTCLLLVMTVVLRVIEVISANGKYLSQTPRRGASVIFELDTCLVIGASISFLLAAAMLGKLWSLNHLFIPFVFLRSAFLNNGVSPLKPLVLLGIAGVALSIAHLRQINLLEDSAIMRSGFLGFGGSSFCGLDQQEKALGSRLWAAAIQLPGAYWLLAIAFLQGLYFMHKAHWFSFALDGQIFGVFYIYSSMVIYVGLFFLVLRFILTWCALHNVLRRLYLHPTRGGYQHLRTERFGDSQGLRIRLREPAHSTGAVEFCLERARELLHLAKINSKSVVAKRLINSGLASKIEACEACLTELQSASDRRHAVMADLDLQRRMASLSAVLTESSDPVWRLGSASKPLQAVAGKSKEHELINQLELFVATRVLDLLRRVLPQLKNLAGFAVAGVLAMMLASSAYPMPAPETGLWMAWSGVLVEVTVSIYVFVSMNMNRVVSMLEGTMPGYFSMTGSFAVQFLFFAVLPILTMFGAQYPHVLNNILSWTSSVSASIR